MAKIFTYRGKTIEELKKLSIEEFAKLIPARERRTLKRGMLHSQKRLLYQLKKGKTPKTHCRDMVITPEMVDKTIRVYSGKEWTSVIITSEMLGHRLGEFSQTRKKVAHSAPGIGATRSSAALSVR